MSSFSLVHWLVLALYIFLVVYPVGRILGRLGYSKWLSILAIIPFANLIGLWVLSLVRWPVEGPSEAAR